MASGQIRMTPDTMRERAGEYRTEADNVQSVIDKMTDYWTHCSQSGKVQHQKHMQTSLQSLDLHL